jgi:hypothetical protein
MNFRDIMDTNESWSLLQAMSFQVWIAALEEERLANQISYLVTQFPAWKPISLISHQIPCLEIHLLIKPPNSLLGNPSPYLATQFPAWKPISLLSHPIPCLETHLLT